MTWKSIIFPLQMCSRSWRGAISRQSGSASPGTPITFWLYFVTPQRRTAQRPVSENSQKQMLSRFWRGCTRNKKISWRPLSNRSSSLELAFLWCPLSKVSALSLCLSYPKWTHGSGVHLPTLSALAASLPKTHRLSVRQILLHL